MITVLSWYWHQPVGRAEYTPDTVNRWASMVRRNLKMPHRIACVTDQPEGIDSSVAIIPPPRDFEHVRVPSWNEKKPQCLRRLSMFSPNAGRIFGDRFVCMDLDVVIGDDLTPLFNVKDDFRMMIGTEPRLRPYNGSMVMMTAGARPQVYTDFTPDRATAASRHFLGSDQAWIAFSLGWGEKTWSEKDGALWFSPRYAFQMPKCRLMFFPGLPKPWEVTGQRPLDQWVQRHYVAPSALVAA